MLPSHHRLRKRQAFDSLYRSGRLYRGRCLTLRCLSVSDVTENQFYENKAAGLPSRFAVIVSKKVCKNAVNRNRIKRRIRHQLQEFLADIPPGYLVAISANRSRPLRAKGLSQGQKKSDVQKSQESNEIDPASELLWGSRQQLNQELRELLYAAGLLSGTAQGSSHG